MLLGNVIQAVRVCGYFVYMPFIHHVCLSECRLALKDSTLQRDCVLYRMSLICLNTLSPCHNCLVQRQYALFILALIKNTRLWILP